jgi:integrase
MQGFTDRYIASLHAKDGAAQTDFTETGEKYRGLAMRVSRSGRRTWVFVFRLGGQRVRLSFGEYPDLSVAQAHDRVIEYRRALAEKPPRDPREIEQKSGVMTIANLVDSYLELHARPNLRSAKQIEYALHKHVVPLIGTVKLTELHARDINRVIDPIIARGKNVAAARTFEQCRALLNWAVQRGDLDISPMSRMKKPADYKPGDRTLSDDEIRIFWDTVGVAFKTKSVPRILKLCLVTAQRVGEVAGMAKAELDLDKAIWIIPKERSKNKHAHLVPLTPLALEIINDAIIDSGNSKFVFPHRDGGLSSAAATTAVAAHSRNIKITHFTPHDLRRTACTMMADLGVMDVIIGHVINHRSVFKHTVTQRHYLPRSYERERREALELWADRLTAIISGKAVADVIPLRG